MGVYNHIKMYKNISVIHEVSDTITDELIQEAWRVYHPKEMLDDDHIIAEIITQSNCDMWVLLEDDYSNLLPTSEEVNVLNHKQFLIEIDEKLNNVSTNASNFSG